MKVMHMNAYRRWSNIVVGGINFTACVFCFKGILSAFQSYCNVALVGIMVLDFGCRIHFVLSILIICGVAGLKLIDMFPSRCS